LGGPRIVNWPDDAFARVKRAGLTAVGYASGWGDPHLLHDRATRLGVIGCLDVEAGIRGDGPWVGSWLADAPGFGIYGAQTLMQKPAAFHQLAKWSAGSGSDGGAPGNLGIYDGWQYAGNVGRYGMRVDLAVWRDSFGEDDDVTGPQAEQLAQVHSFALGATQFYDGKPAPNKQLSPYLHAGWQLAHDAAQTGGGVAGTFTMTGSGTVQ
jgi:hypothetical protein